jgi:hypothetical protein
MGREDESFPAPEAELMDGRVWSRVDIEAWVEATGRTITGESYRERTTKAAIWRVG